MLCTSDLMTLIGQATEVRREQKFALSIPMASLTQQATPAEALVDAAIFVQGSIDMLLTMPDGGIVLVDYKTDRVTDAERESEALLAQSMKEKHGYQMACYTEAVQALFGKAPDKCCIYSLPLGRIVEM